MSRKGYGKNVDPKVLIKFDGVRRVKTVINFVLECPEGNTVLRYEAVCMSARLVNGDIPCSNI